LLKLEIYCDDHSSFSSTTTVQIWIISYILHITNFLRVHLRWIISTIVSL